MKKHYLLLTVFLCMIITSLFSQSVNEFQPFTPPISFEEAGKRADSILQKMSIEEKIEMIGGHRSFFVKGFEQYGIPEFYLADATQGVHIRKELSNLQDKSTAFPCPLALTATWNPALSYQYAKSVGEQCRVGNVAVLLGPGMNIYRISENGRNFEYFGEDPYLAARMIEQYVVGMQSTGTITTLKHFICNNSDHRRRFSNSVVDERTLHEIYMPAFKAGVDAGALAVMTSYNQLNGEYAGQSDYVINNLLRKDLGFKWLVMTDWTSVFDPEKVIKSGQDLDMPGDGANRPHTKALGKKVYVRLNAKRLLDEGKVSETDINRMAKSIMRTFIAMGMYDRPIIDTSFKKNFKKHEEVALNTAREGIVLLKNENILPLKKETKNILLTGYYIDEYITGGGSAYVEGYDKITMSQAFKNEFENKVLAVKNATDMQIKDAGIVFFSIGTKDSESWNRPFDLPDSVEKSIDKVCQLNKNVVVIVNSGSGINMSRWNTKVKGIIYAWYPGQNGNQALVEIITGKINPSGKLPMSIEKKFEDSPGYPYLALGDTLYSIKGPDVAWGTPIQDIVYKEGVLVGYRWYDTKKINPLYPFGFGLSYTKFDISNLKIANNNINNGGLVQVTCTVKNIGTQDGAEVVQVYVNDEQASVIRPIKELKAFKKVFLKPGESQTITFNLDKNAFSFYDVNSKSWKVEPGKFNILAGSSSREIKQTVSLNIQ